MGETRTNPFYFVRFNSFIHSRIVAIIFFFFAIAIAIAIAIVAGVVLFVMCLLLYTYICRSNRLAFLKLSLQLIGYR
jgi:hypothetical protein